MTYLVVKDIVVQQRYTLGDALQMNVISGDRQLSTTLNEILALLHQIDGIGLGVLPKSGPLAQTPQQRFRKRLKIQRFQVTFNVRTQRSTFIIFDEETLIAPRFKGEHMPHV